METTPSAAELIAAAVEGLRNELLPALSGRAAFQARVIANVLEIARRELEQAPAADDRERSRLSALLFALGPGQDGAEAPADAPPSLALASLRAALCTAIRTDRIGLDTPGLRDHLWADVLARLAIEQPTYPGYLRETGPDTAHDELHPR